MRRLFASGIPLGVLVALMGSGCAYTDLKDANQRLVEARDRLLSENNRLDSELKAARQEIALLQSELASGVPTPAPVPGPKVSHNPSNSSAVGELIIPELPDDDTVTAQRTPLGIKLTVPHRVFFASGQAKLSTRGQSILQNTIAPILKRSEYSSNVVRVEGHTDDVPIRKVRHLYPTNWELSTARACTVVRYLVDRGGVRKDRIYPSGFSSTRPVSTSKSKNRRVEILILNRQS